MVGYDFPLLGIFWTMVLFFLFFGWIILVFYVFADIFRSPDLGGWAKAAWLIVVVIFPLLGTLVYALARGGGMADRYTRRSPTQDEALRAYVQLESASTARVR